MQLKKSLGQNFLSHNHIIQKIVDVAEPVADTLILEIGPGDGALTAELLHRGARVVAVETDERMIQVLSTKFSQYIAQGMLQLITADISEWDERVLSDYAESYTIVANIPYYITGLIIRKFLISSFSPESMTLIMQREVVDRIVARDGKESLLSLGVKAYGLPTSQGIIKRGNFRPIPKVDSALITISNISRDFFNDIDEERFWEVVKKGFAHRRKQLRKNLKGVISDHVFEQFFAKYFLPESVRGEDLSLDMWKSLLTIDKNNTVE